MDALKAQFERIRLQLAALTATQKMLVMALVAVMVLTVLYWGKYAGNAEMVPVLDQALSAEDIGPITQQLKLAGVQYTVVGEKVLVPADRQSEILADLMFARALPNDTHSAFETMSKQINPFTSNTQMDMAFSEATATELSGLISRFPGVSSARVIINAKNDHRIEGSIPPSATVFITTKGTPEHEKDLVRAAADGVAHAVSGLVPGQISVIVNGSSKRVPDSEGDTLPGGDDMMERRQKREEMLEQKIRNQFSFIRDLTVTVNCDVEIRTTDQNVVKYNKPDSLITPIHTTSDTNESVNTPPSGVDPGATANTNAGSNGPVSIAGGGGSGSAGGNTQNTQKEESTFGVWAGETRTHITTPAGKDTVQSATVRVPSSYFAAIYKKVSHSTKEVDAPPEFAAVELQKIRDGVKTVVGLKTDADLSVDSYNDIPVDLVMATGPVAQASTLISMSGHAKEIGIGVLAVVSLLMMATMVRKSTLAALVLPASTQSPIMIAAGLSSLGSGENIAGEVSAGSSALDGMEMDEDSVRTQQMLDQVSTMVKENPDGAATLVKRWLSRP